MAGTIKLDGTQFLEKVNNEFKITNSELKLKSTGNTIVDSSGNAVVSESGGNVTLTADAAVIEGSSSGDLVRITQTGSGNALVVEDEINPDSTPFVVDNAGNVSIGIAVAGRKFHVYGTGTATKVEGSSTSVYVQLSCNSQSNAESGYIGYNSAQALSLWTAETERMRIDSSGNLQFNSGYGSAATAYGCRAWVNFNGAGTVAIRDSGNVSSITDNYTGNYYVNFTTNMPDVNYVTNISKGSYGSASVRGYNIIYNQETSRVRVETRGETNQEIDSTLICVAITR